MEVEHRVKVEPGKYRHWKGGIYDVMYVESSTSNMLPTVVYIDGKYIYRRILSEWFDKIGFDYRFVRVD